MADLVLGGCSRIPLAAYLSAVGVVRVLGRQVDPSVSGRWTDDGFVVGTDLDRDQLADFFVDEFAPTPIITPWNNGSGFDRASHPPGAKLKTADTVVEAVANSSDGRFAAHRASIAAARRLVARPEWGSLDKDDRVALCRNSVPDEMVDWIDAAVVLTSDSRAFPPLLGTGGNDGRLDFGVNVMQRLLDVLPIDGAGRARSRELIGHTLFGDTDVRLDAAIAGQFDPYGNGGPESGPTGAAKAISNPWSFVLAFEGAVAFASGVARKMGVAASAASVGAMPFTVAATPAAFASAADESSRGEFWAPIWDRATTWRELERVIAEARVEYRGRSARDGLDFVRAISLFGAERGITEFVRFGFLERNGLATFCVPLGVFPTAETSVARVLGDLDRWIGSVRRTPHIPASAAADVRAVAEMQFEAVASDRVEDLQHVLAAVARLERLAASSARLRESTRGPVQGLRATEWIDLLNDGSAEFEVAAGLASLRRPTERWGLIRQLTLDCDWNGRPPGVAGFGVRPLVEVLADCLVRIAQRDPADRRADDSWCGPVTARWAPLDAFADAASGALDWARVEMLLSGLMLLDWRRYRSDQEGDDLAAIDRVPAALQVFQPIFHHRGLRSSIPSRRRLVPDRAVPRLLAADRVEDAIGSALRSARIAGCPPRVGSPNWLAAGHDGRHLAATSLIPISDWASLNLLRRVSDVAQPTESESSHEQPANSA